MSHGVAGSDWKSLKRKEKCCDKPIERWSNFTKGFYPRCVKVKAGGKVKIVLGRLTQLDCNSRQNTVAAVATRPCATRKRPQTLVSGGLPSMRAPSIRSLATNVPARVARNSKYGFMGETHIVYIGTACVAVSVCSPFVSAALPSLSKLLLFLFRHFCIFVSEALKHMPRDRREIWSPAKRSIIGEWRIWAKSNPGAAAADDAFGTFYLHLQTKNAHLLTFPSDDHFKAVREWLAEEGLIKP